MREGILNPSHFEADDTNGCPEPGVGSWARKIELKVLNKGTIRKSAPTGASKYMPIYIQVCLKQIFERQLKRSFSWNTRQVLDTD